MSKRKSITKWLPKHTDLLCEVMAEEFLLPEQVINKYADKFPVSRTYYRRYNDDAELRERVLLALTIIFDHYHVQLDELSKMSATEAFIHYGKAKPGDDINFNEARDFLRSRVSVLQFYLAKLGSNLTRKYNSKVQIEHTGNVESQYTIIVPDYIKLANNSKVINGIAEDTQD